MIFLHGGVVCPAELMALLAALPLVPAVWAWARCRAKWTWQGLRPPFCHWCETRHRGERKVPGRTCPGPLIERPPEWDR